MKVLWITNILFPDVCKELGIEVPITGGWMHSLAKNLIINNEKIVLSIVSIYQGEQLRLIEINNVKYFLIPQKLQKKRNKKELEKLMLFINESYMPNLVHIHGTELSIGLSYIKSCGNKNVVISIQGMPSVYERYYFGGLPMKTLISNITLRDIIRFDSLLNQRRAMFISGTFEKETIKSVKHIIGRTSWDREHIWAIEPSINYHFCNETLRSIFYTNKWEIEKCERFSIFLSQGYYPIKGLHQVIKALPLVIKHFPDTKVYVSGANFFTGRGLKIHGYGKYIIKLIKSLEIEDKLIFIGTLSEHDMCKRYLKSHIFVCPSAIENSPNSIGEAQILGVPCIGSYVGGIPDLITDNETGLLYRFEEVEMLAAKICRIFSNDKIAVSFSEKERVIAMKRHDGQCNAKKMIDIYNNILEVCNL